ncbi:MAG: ABC transporter permease [Dehalococcoidia bacterium]|nr:ABC transporter permease [Dehalococcoidia bacterium]
MAVWHLFVANLKMIARDKQALFWALVFPLIFVVVFGLFRLDQPSSAKLTVVDQSQDRVSLALVEGLKGAGVLEIDQSRDLASAREDLAKGQISFVLVIPPGMAQTVAGGATVREPVSLVLLYDQAHVMTIRVQSIVRGVVDRANLLLADAPSFLALTGEPVQARQIRYFDFLLPGFVGMGVMIYAVVGMATILASYRQEKILKRVLATPLSVGKFFVGLVLAHVVLALVQAGIILGAGVLLFHGHVYGNLFWVAVLVMLGNIVFLSLGFIVGSFAESSQAANGIGNAVTMPMMFFSGVFFSSDSLPAVMRVVVKYLPLTPLLEALRGVALDAKPLWDFPTQIAILLAWVAVTAVVAVRVFRFS